MSIRFKLFIPLLLLSALLAAYAHYILLPKFIEFVEEENKSQMSAHLRSVAEGLEPLLLENQLAVVYENLNALLNENEDWVSIRLLDPDGRKLYPLSDQESAVTGENMYPVIQKIVYLDYPLGSLEVIYDLTNDILKLSQIEYSFQIGLLFILIAQLLFSTFVFEWLVRRPVSMLASASQRLAQGDFLGALPGKHNDEIGRLVQNFIVMRDSINSSQSALKDEIERHKDTSKALFEEKERVSYHATHDSLTNLVNRREFEDRLAMAFETAKQGRESHALLYMDLDQFKIVNDTCGHVAGDELLRQIGALLERQIRSTDTLARLGGDEFGVLLQSCSGERATTIAEKLLEVIQSFRFAWADQNFVLGVSIGIVEISEQSANLTDLLADADAACYAAKESGRNRVHYFQHDDVELAKRQGEMRWISRLTSALKEDRFTLYGQPIVPVSPKPGGNAHYEILLRMLDESGEIIPPGAFIGAAERYNLMHQIDRWVIRNTFSFLTEYFPIDQQRHCPLISINLSGESLGSDTFLPYVKTQFQQCRIDPQNICFEITETAAIADLSNATRIIDSLKSLGCRFSLDDFGSGLSSFAYLKTLPVDFLKIDGMFVKDIATDPIDFAMVKSISEIGHVMGMQMIAEFVENKEILDKLASIHVDYAQGYGIKRPAPLNEIIQRIEPGMLAVPIQ
jgi:diguanylate cyclase (GGDEF)-like protein